MRVGAERGQEAERFPLSGAGEHRAGGKVDPETGDLLGQGLRLLEGLGHGPSENIEIVLRILVGRIVIKRLFASGQPLVDHGIRVLVDRAAQFLPGSGIHHDGTPRERAKIHADDKFSAHDRHPERVGESAAPYRWARIARVTSSGVRVPSMGTTISLL